MAYKEFKGFFVKLLVQVRNGVERYYNDEYDYPVAYMDWTTRLEERTCKHTELSHQLELLNDGDYDFDSQVLFVTTMDGEILLDFNRMPKALRTGDLPDEIVKQVKEETKLRERQQDDLVERIVKYPEQVLGGK